MKTPLSFLLASVQNYLSDGADRARRLKRDENMVIVPLDTKSAEDRYRLGGSILCRQTIFDARWAITLIDEAITRLGREYAAQGKTSTFETA
jgi:hypothetical protein